MPVGVAVLVMQTKPFQRHTWNEVDPAAIDRIFAKLGFNIEVVSILILVPHDLVLKVLRVECSSHLRALLCTILGVGVGAVPLGLNGEKKAERIQ